MMGGITVLIFFGFGLLLIAAYVAVTVLNRWIEQRSCEHDWLELYGDAIIYNNWRRRICKKCYATRDTLSDD